MAEEEGFEPPRAVTPLSVFETDPFSQTWVLLHFDDGAYRTPACGAGALLAERKPHHEMIGKTGFEPATSRTRTVCSTKLSYFPMNALERIRTPNLLIRSQMLYPIELRAHVPRAGLEPAR